MFTRRPRHKGLSVRLKNFFVSSRNIDRASATWNAGASLMSSFQSVLMLVLVSVFLGETEAGIFSIATAQAFLFWTIGSYGIRRYQASDVEHHFTFREYVLARVITSLAMIVVCFVTCTVLVWSGGYSYDKAGAVFVVTLLRVIDAVEDVFVGFLQQSGRLDVGAKISFVRYAITTVAFLVPLVAGQGLLFSLGITLVVSMGCLAVLVRLVVSDFVSPEARQGEMRKALKLLRTCFPLFLAMFLTLYISNAPKYGIDAVLNDEVQARFNYLSMPSFVIQMLAIFIFNPMVYKMSTSWVQGRISDLKKMVGQVVMWIAGITAVCLVGGALVGLPVLSWLYQADLGGYLWEFLLLLLGGGFVALGGFLATVLTIIRYQRVLIIGYIASTLVAVTASWWIRWDGLMGACILYCVLFILQCAIFVPIMAHGIRHRETDKTDAETSDGIQHGE